ncbi:hypothetical protein RHS01_06467 [Rhizoctonia solani]|uniref:CCHC-type domain-containing protein n=1 Tax=Rhizoctonia solani TaxID=456999 RepID=A0A8H7IF32_9AGAM|nr:hypothetical protein RHS01_06467 [Rhizoctonia solani]
MEEVREAGVKARTNLENISQAIDTVKDGLRSLQTYGPRTPEDTKPPAVEATPRPLSKVNPIGLTSWVSFWPKPSKGSPPLPNPLPYKQYPASPISPFISASPIPNWNPCPSTSGSNCRLSCPAVAHKDVGMDPAKRPDVPHGSGGLILPPDEYEGCCRAWAHPHLDQLGSHQAIIQTVEGFKLEFLAAFGNPDATRAAKRKITTLTQSGTCADYITKFRTLAMELDWNNAALRGQFAVASIGSCKTQHLSLTTPSVRSVLAIRQWIVSLADHLTRKGTSTGQSSTGSKKLSDNPNFVLKKNKIARAASACIKCGKMGHKFAECRTAGSLPLLRTRGRLRKPKIGKDSKYQLGKE